MNTKLIAAGVAMGVAVALHAQVASAQSPEQNAFYLISGKDTIIAERVTRTPGELRGEFLDRARGGRMEYVATLSADASITKLATHYYRGAADTVGDRATFEMAGDHVVAQMGAASPANVPSIAGALPIVNPSVAFLEQMVLRAKAISGGDTVHSVQLPLFILGAPQPVPATITFVHTDSVTLSYAGVVMRLAISPAGRLVSGLAPALNIVIARGAALRSLASERRDYGAPPGAPYTAEEVVVRTPAGIKLTGTLTLPTMRPSGRVPAIVTITGSGPEDRDEASVKLGDYRPFREIADTLGRRGIAVLRLDDRGVNGSDLGLQSVTSADFADDIRAGVAYLRTRAEIDGARVGLVGHSEGGIIAPMVAESDPRLRAIVLMAGSASTGRDILRAQQVYAVDTMYKITGPARDAALAQSRAATDSLATSSPWMAWFLSYDPTTAARRVKTPTLILQGETDHQVPASEAAKLAAALRAGGNSSVTVRLFPETNHLFVADKIGGFSYENLPSLRVRKEVLGAIADWLTTQFR